MRNLVLFSNNKVVGLDDTESLIGPSPTLGTSDVLYQGIYEPLCPNCLSLRGKDIVNSILKSRCRSAGRARLRWTDYFPLSPIRAPLRFVIYGKKTESATYMTAKNFQHDLVFFNAIGQRKILVESIFVKTFKASQRFLRRYLLLNFILNVAPYGNVLREQRNPEYLIKAFQDACIEGTIDSQRIIFNPACHESHDEFGVIRRNRHRDHVSSAQVGGLFASEVDWLVAHFLAASGTYQDKFDYRSWLSFCKVSRKARKAASHDGVEHWGRTTLEAIYETNDNIDFSRDFCQFGTTEDKDFWAKRHKKQSKKKKPRSTPFVAVTVLDQPVWDDADFSSCDERDSDSQHVESPCLPRFAERRPVIDRDGYWRCRGCTYSFHMGHLDTKELSTLDNIPFPVPFKDHGAKTLRYDSSASPIGPDRHRFGGKLRTYMKEMRVTHTVFHQNRNVRYAFYQIINAHYKGDHEIS